MEQMEIGSYLNFVVCLILVLSGPYWLPVFEKKWRSESRFIFRAFICWWLGWLVLLVVWVLRALDPNINKILILTLSDLNAVFWILVYFNLTRGNEFSLAECFTKSVTILVALALGYAAIYLYFRNHFQSADEIHESLELGVGFVVTMLLGWGFSLRYNTNSVLIVGYVYGFAQPFAYKAIFHAKDLAAPSAKAFVVVLVVMAFLKIVWATVVTRYFLQKPETTENLVTHSRSGTNSGLFQEWTTGLTIQTAILGAAFTLFLTYKMRDLFSEVMKAIGEVIAFFGVLFGVLKLWDRFSSRLRHR